MASMIARDQLDIRQHAAQRMLERNISVADVLIAVNSGATIEDYPDDTPFPSRLTLGWVDERPVHVVWATAVAISQFLQGLHDNPHEADAAVSRSLAGTPMEQWSAFTGMTKVNEIDRRYGGAI